MEDKRKSLIISHLYESGEIGVGYSGNVQDLLIVIAIVISNIEKDQNETWTVDRLLKTIGEEIKLRRERGLL